MRSVRADAHRKSYSFCKTQIRLEECRKEKRVPVQFTAKYKQDAERVSVITYHIPSSSYVRAYTHKCYHRTFLIGVMTQG